MRQRYQNNFDFLRFAAASLVIVCHGYSLMLGYDGLSLSEPFLLLGDLGVAVFFVISGYLISASWEAEPAPRRFFWKRFLRIVPGLIAAIGFTLLVIGPIVSSLSPLAYFSTLRTWDCLQSMPFFLQGGLLGLFSTNPVTFVNASLWTIPVEFAMYGLVVLLGLAGLLRKRNGIMLMLSFAVFCYTAVWFLDPYFVKVQFPIFFLLGVILYQHRDSVVYDARIVLAMLAALLFSLQYSYLVLSIVSFICLPYIILYFARMPVPSLHNFARHGDFSYGLYIYAYPIQQTLVFFWQDTLSIIQLTVLSFALTLPCAVLSWKFIESKALQLKNSDLRGVRSFIGLGSEARGE